MLSFVVLLMTLPQPRPTLFPYTTLFRSHRSLSTIYFRLGRVTEARREKKIAEAMDAAIQAKDQARDRKSTRLNSSHTVISYAVFCLKKKKKYKKIFKPKYTQYRQ